MQELDPKYVAELDKLGEEIQASDELATYLEEEEETDYQRLKETFEPRIGLLFDQVALEFPLQLIDFERHLLDVKFEGLFLPKILGYSILRGEVNDQFKYARPQSHFKAILLTICNSANFDILKKRIGQSIQIGFSLSSDIWITNLINSIDNKRIRYYLQSHKLDKYRVIKHRMAGYNRYKRQFKNDHYQTAEFPENVGELKVLFLPLYNFLLFRLGLKDADNGSILPRLRSFLEEKNFWGTIEHLRILGLHLGYFETDDAAQKKLGKKFNEIRGSMPEFQQNWLSFLMDMHEHTVGMTPEADLRLGAVVQTGDGDQLNGYYQLLEVIHGKGYINDEAQEAVKVFYNSHEGTSLVNECVRKAIFRYFNVFLSNLEPTDYSEFFEITKVMAIYIGIFRNQQFNQDLKILSMKYVHSCLKVFTDKRGKDYQDIKKFVTTTFQDLNFLKEKEVVELFKTRRKKKKPTPNA